MHRIRLLLKIYFKRFISHFGVIRYYGSKKGVYLTFDDGPDHKNNTKILEILGKYSVKATFFVNGVLAEKYPILLRNISDDGHSIGNHMYSHCSIRNMSSAECIEEANKTEEIIFNTTGNKAIMMRPPYGEITLRFVVNMWLRNRIIFLWSNDSHDSKINDGPELMKMLKKSNIINGSIILLHEDYSHTVDALPDIIEYIQDIGYSIIPL